MTIQPDFVKQELLHELSESFRLNSQIPTDLYSRYRIKRGLRTVPAYWSARAALATFTATYSMKASASRSRAASPTAATMCTT